MTGTSARSAPRWAAMGLIALLLASAVPVDLAKLAFAASSTRLEDPGAGAPYGASAFWATQGASVLLGGANDTGTTNEIRLEDRSSDDFRLPASGGALPQPTAFASVAGGGVDAWLFGGDTPDGLTDGIVAVHAGADSSGVDPSASPVLARLPAPRSDTSAVWTGTQAFVFGGSNNDRSGATLSDQIVRYDPATDRTAVMRAHLPTPRAGTAAVWDGKAAYIFGGWTAATSEHLLADIVRYDPATDTATRMPTMLPTPLYGASAFTDSFGYLYLVGGFTTCCEPFMGVIGDATGQVVRYDPTNDTVTVLDVTVPSTVGRGVWQDAVAFDGTSAHVFGGLSCYNEICDYADVGIARVTPNQPPVAAIAPVAPAECHDGHAPVRLDASPSYDRDFDALVSYNWSAPGAAFDDASSLTPLGAFPFGSTRTQLLVGDGDLTDTAFADVQVVDTQPPSIALLRPLPEHVYVNDWYDAYDGQAVNAPLMPAPVRALLASAAPSVLALGPLTLSVDAEDACGVASVEFAASDGERAVVTQPQQGTHNYTFRLDPVVDPLSFDPSNPFFLNLTVQARVSDLGGNTRATSASLADVPTNTTACSLLFSPTICRELPALPQDQPVPPPDLKPLCVEFLSQFVCDLAFGP